MDSLRSLLAKNPVIKACFERESGQTDQNVEPVNIVILISETENAHPHAISAKGTITDRKKVVGKYISDINEHSSFINLDLKVEGLIEKGEKESTIALRILPGDSTDAPGFTIQIQGTLDNIKFDWIHIQNVEISLGEMNNPVGTTALNPDSEGAENPQESENKDLDLANMLQAVEAPQEDLDLANMLSVFEIPQEPEGRDLSFIQLMEPNLGTSASGNLGLSDMLSPGFGDGEFEDWTFKSDYNWTFAPDDDWTFAPDYNYANRELLPYSHLMEAPASNYGYSFYPLTTGTAYSQIPSLEPHTDYGQPAVNAEIAPTRGSDNKDNDEPLASFHGTPEDDSECVTVKLNDDGATPYLSSKTGNISLSSTFTSTSRGIHNDPDIISAGCQVSHTTPVSQQVPMTDSVNKIQESGNPELQTIDQIMDVTPPLMAVETSVQAQIVIPLPITVKISDLAQGVIPYLQIPARVQSVASRPEGSTQDVGLPLRALKISALAPNMAPPLVKTGEQKLKNKRVHTNTKISDLAQDVALDSVKSKRSTQQSVASRPKKSTQDVGLLPITVKISDLAQGVIPYLQIPARVQSVASRPKKSTQDVGLPLRALEISALPRGVCVKPFPKGMTFHPVKKDERIPKKRNEIYAAICHYIEEDLLDYFKIHNRSLQDIMNDPAGPGEFNKLISERKIIRIHHYLQLMGMLSTDKIILSRITHEVEESKKLFCRIKDAIGDMNNIMYAFRNVIKRDRNITDDYIIFQIIFLLEDYFIPIQLEKMLVVYEENIKEPKHTITSGSTIEKLFKNIYVQIYQEAIITTLLQSKFIEYIKGFDLHTKLGSELQRAKAVAISQIHNMKLPPPESEDPVSEKPCSRKRKSLCSEGTNDAKRSKSNDAKPGSKQVSARRTVKKTRKESNSALVVSVGKTSNIKFPPPESEDLVSEEPCSRKRKSLCSEGTNDAKRSKSNDAKPGSKQVSARRTVKKTRKESNSALVVSVSKTRNIKFPPPESEDLVSEEPCSRKRKSLCSEGTNDAKRSKKSNLEFKSEQSSAKRGVCNRSEASKAEGRRQQRVQHTQNVEERRITEIQEVYQEFIDNNPKYTSEDLKRDSLAHYKILQRLGIRYRLDQAILSIQISNFLKICPLEPFQNYEKLPEEMINALDAPQTIKVMRHFLVLMHYCIKGARLSITNKSPDTPQGIEESSNQGYFQEALIIHSHVRRTIELQAYYRNVLLHHVIPLSMFLLKEYFIPAVFNELFSRYLPTNTQPTEDKMITKQLLRAILKLSNEEETRQPLVINWNDFRIASLKDYNGSILLSGKADKKLKTDQLLRSYIDDHKHENHHMRAKEETAIDTTITQLCTIKEKFTTIYTIKSGVVILEAFILVYRSVSRKIALLRYNIEYPENSHTTANNNQKIQALCEIIRTEFIPLLINQILDKYLEDGKKIDTQALLEINGTAIWEERSKDPGFPSTQSPVMRATCDEGSEPMTQEGTPPPVLAASPTIEPLVAPALPRTQSPVMRAACDEESEPMTQEGTPPPVLAALPILL